MLVIVLLNLAVIGLAVLIHYEFLYRMTQLIPVMRVKHRFRIVIGVFGALIAHSIEVWLFAIVYYFINMSGHLGKLTGNFDGSLLDCVYFSYTTFTTLGFGDIEAQGKIKHLAGLESLTGLLLITWTASFLYFEMQRHWGKQS